MKKIDTLGARTETSLEKVKATLESIEDIDDEKSHDSEDEEF